MIEADDPPTPSSARQSHGQMPARSEIVRCRTVVFTGDELALLSRGAARGTQLPPTRLLAYRPSLSRQTGDDAGKKGVGWHQLT